MNIAKRFFTIINEHFYWIFWAVAFAVAILAGCFSGMRYILMMAVGFFLSDFTTTLAAYIVAWQKKKIVTHAYSWQIFGIEVASVGGAALALIAIMTIAGARW